MDARGHVRVGGRERDFGQALSSAVYQADVSITKI